MYKEGLKKKLLQYLKDNGTLTRKDAYQWSKRNHYEQATFERRAREMTYEVGVITLDDNMKPRKNDQDHIAGWKWKHTTIFK